MQARFYANMRTVVGTSSLDVNDVRVDTFRKLIAFLIEQHPDVKFHLLDSNGDLRPDVPVYVDGRNPRLTHMGIDSPLKPDSVVSFFSPISSGRMNVEVLREPNFRNRRSMKVNSLRPTLPEESCRFDVDHGITAKEL
jgi:molybdopterin converting factor small subunit